MLSDEGQNCTEVTDMRSDHYRQVAASWDGAATNHFIYISILI